LVYLKVIWYILPVLVSCSKKNLATLVVIPFRRKIVTLLKIKAHAPT
jgi:hypothetical protein